MLFFVRRRWAIRVIEETGLPIKGPTATLLIDLIVWASEQGSSAAGSGLPKAEAVLLTAMRLSQNPTAAERLVRSLPFTLEQAQGALDATRAAALAVAARHGFDALVASEAAG